MSDLKKYEGVIPAFYACYDDQGEISPERVRALVEYFIVKGVQGLYVNGSSGECIYQSVADRKLILEEVMAVAKGKLTIIAHVACNNTKDSVELARHAEELEWMPLRPFRRSISACQNIVLPTTGMKSVQPHPIQTLLSIISRNWQGLL